MLANIQLLRVFAASAVVVYHCSFEFFGYHTDFGGVAVFFVLSGYLMCRIKDTRNAFHFAAERFWRIVPSYWLATAIVIIAFQRGIPLEHALLSALFIPHEWTHGMFPVHGVGWTLNMEVYFYAIFALAIFLNRRLAPFTSAIIILAIYVGLPFVTDNISAIFYYTHQYILCFICGIAVWYLSEWLSSKLTNYTLPKTTFPIVLAIYVLVFGVALKGVNCPVLGYFTVSSLVFLAVLSAKLGADLKSRSIMILADASYACYLIHTIVIELLRYKKFEIDGSFGLTAFTLSLSWLIAIGWHHIFERKNVTSLRKSFSRRTVVSAS